MRKKKETKDILGIEKEKKIKKVINIVFIVMVVCLTMITIDIVCITRFQVGPLFAIRTNVYADGGSKVYYGLGYKVIKYHQTEGKQGTKVGLWTMPYTISSTPIDMLDLAIAYRNNPQKTYRKYYDQYLKLTGSVHTIDNQKKVMTLRYTDPDGKYTLDVVGLMHDDNTDLSIYQVGQTVSFVGSVSGYQNKTGNQPNKIRMRDCFMK